MSTLLEITGDDIALLNDADLRSLVGRLCEADFRLAGVPTKGIIWGGHQDASDGGFDVTVRIDFDPPQNSRVPRRATGFQVKKPDMQPSKIEKEMRPNGKLREGIEALISKGGAYIIASSAGSTTEPALKSRIKAMKLAVANEPNHDRLHVDFLDRGQIATWVRSHPSLILWVRNKIGRSMQGWQSYSNWANPLAGTEEEYIIDEEIRLYDGTNSDSGILVVDGLLQLRLRLSKNGSSVRLTGLSGVGKTRFIQALFDDRVGEQALNQSLAYYTDISHSPIPDPPSFANQLVATKAKAVLIVDNCSLELHRTLTKLCAGSMVSLLTVEYDIRDDIPEETDVFRLEPSSDSLIEKLLEQRYPHISQINIQTLAKFASGNARVAIALANTLKRDASLSTLKDEDLFDRLFHQRHHPNDSLRVSAEICSLVYSFDGDDTASPGSELEFLAKLAQKSTRELYRDIAELKNRGLVQKRNVWRAVLPHAIANRLAKDALTSIPKQIIVDAFLSSGSERLIKSFTRRLGYLHDCEPAIEIAKAWLKPDGWIGLTRCNFSSLGLAVFENIAPIAPKETLTMLERTTNEIEGLSRIHSHEFIRLLRHLAYEVELFPRSIFLLSRLALLEKPNINDGGSARAILKTLFHIILSGTHAPAQSRSMIIERLTNSSVEAEQELGIILLDEALESHHFMGSPIDAFGARSRDFGYHPKTNEEIINWYRCFLAICTQQALLDKPISIEAKRTLSSNLRGLWSIGVRFDQKFLEELENSIIQIHSKEPWNDCWISVKGIIRYDGKKMEQQALSKLKQLSQHLEPATLLEQARTYALTKGRLNFDLEDDYDGTASASDHWKNVQEKTRQIGAAVAKDETVFTEILPELVSSIHERLFIFGVGLADGSENRAETWYMLYDQIEKIPSEKRQINVLLGFLNSCATHDPEFYHSLLDSLINDKLLGQWFPYFQMISDIDERGIERLHKALDEGNVEIYGFERLAWKCNESINDDDLAALLQKLLAKDEGIKVIIGILSTRFAKGNGKAVILSERLLEVSRQVILQCDYEEILTRNDHLDFDLARIASTCLQGQDGAQSAKNLCQHLAAVFLNDPFPNIHFSHLLGTLVVMQPYIFLDTFVGQGKYKVGRLRFDNLSEEASLVNQIPTHIITDWCDQDPEARYLLIVSAMQIYSPQDSGDMQWHPIVYRVFEKLPNLQQVFLLLEKQIDVVSWSGSLAETMAKRLNLFTQLSNHSNPIIHDWAIKQHQKLQLEVEKAREHELLENRERFETFE